MDFMKKIMNGRYGTDEFSLVLFVISLVLNILARITKLPLFSYISYIPLFYGFYRILSKDIYRRRAENHKYLKIISPFISKYRKTKKKFKERKIYKYFKCKNCKTELRIPKGKGKIIITCSNCKGKFEGRT